MAVGVDVTPPGLVRGGDTGALNPENSNTKLAEELRLALAWTPLVTRVSRILGESDEPTAPDPGDTAPDDANPIPDSGGCILTEGTASGVLLCGPG